MTDIPSHLRYTKDHEWALVEGDVITVGITRHAVEQLGDITLVTLPAVGTAVTAGQAFGDVDSVKAVSELYAPVSGEVVGTNAALDDKPESVNEDPYGEGWMIRIKVADPAALAELLSPAAYGQLLADAG
jgi:glycine cleavage system H protein